MRKKIPVWLIILLCIIVIGAAAIAFGISHNIINKNWIELNPFQAEININMDSAKSLALEKAGANVANAKFIKTQTEKEDGFIVYDIEFISGSTKYSAEISSIDGSFISWEQETAPGFTSKDTATDIGEEKAKQIALSNAGLTEEEVTNLIITRDFENGNSCYEIEFRKNKTEYSADISATDGSVISWKVDK